jgi:Cu(I)/Ag(I) efflux system membrane fusion protein
MGGIVIHKHAVEGMYVKTGMRIYTIADLNHVWAKLDTYESDLVWIRYGQEVEFNTEAYPGEIFKGKIAFIDPILNAKTRTVKVRVNLKNLQGKLKPGMFVRAIVRANVAEGGKVMDPDMAGKWVCPMHPEIVKDASGDCDICGMPLVRTESLGYIAAGSEKKEAPLVIPATAPLITGKRAVVYVANPEREGIFEGRDIVLGARAGDFYLVHEGLEEGEKVVVKGNFKIDSEIQLAAKPSMMSPEGGGAMPGHHHGGPPPAPKKKRAKNLVVKKFESVPDEFKKQLDRVFDAYFSAQYGFSHDDFDSAKKAAGKLLDALEGVDMALLPQEPHMAWMKNLNTLKKNAGDISEAADISKARGAFYPLSETLASVGRNFGTSGKQPVYRYYCPMIFNNTGAHWLQNSEGVENPYFGSAMFTCGEKVETITPDPTENKHEGH